MSEAPPALFWVQHLLGSGHLRRALAVAGALAGQGVRVTVASGGPPMPWPAPAGVELVQLEPLRSRDEGFSGLVGAAGDPPSEALWAARRTVLVGLVDRLRPHLVVTEMYPFGRRAFRAEVLAFLDRASGLRPAPLVVASVRDVLVAKAKPERWLEMRDIAVARYHRVLVHGDPVLFPFERSFPHAAELGTRIVHTGFVLAAPVRPAAGGDAVVVSAGGGAVGHRLLALALAARPLTGLADRPWRLVGGANLPEAEHAALLATLPPGVVLDRHRDDLPGLMAAAGVSVSQAGYNTVAEGLAGAARMVLVPFDAEGQDEQQARASRLAGLGLAHVVAGELTAASLAAAIDAAALAPRPAPGLAFDGARRSAEILLDDLARHDGARRA